MQKYSGKTAEVYGEYKVQDQVDHYVDVWMADHLQAMGKMANVVDVGCGAGRWFSKFEAEKIIGIDLSQDMLKSVEAAIRKEVDLICGDFIKELDRFENNFDLAFASYSLCTLENPQTALKAIYKALKPGGRLLLSTNIIVDKKDVPSEVEFPREANLDLVPAIEVVSDNQRKKLRLVLHFESADLPIHDFAHTINDYLHQGLNVEQADIFKPCKSSFIDAADKELNDKYFPGQSTSGLISLKGAEAAVVSLCMQAKKVI